jgi:MoaA/NifB/PqqE/SkfB family radical SAM enzyme/polysaccharide pyruvyl transferase WcaK-like protein
MVPGPLKSVSDVPTVVQGGYKLLKKELFVRFGENYPVKPRTLNLLVNDTCNAQCQMCNIWERPPGDALTPTELGDILSDSLFDKLSYVGVSGGEPTLRPDLPQMFGAIVEARPNLQGTGIITNGIVDEVVIDRVEQSGDIVTDAGVDFNVMVSLDGVGEVHDRVRGTEGAFENAVKVLRYFRDETDFSVSVGCTITSDNVWNVDELHQFCLDEDVNHKFRIAEHIDRLYQDEKNEEYIRNFSEREALHLGLFFNKLEHETRLFGTRQQTYRNIRKMILEGSDRTIGCYMQSIGATLDSRGDLAYCAPKSPKLGNCLDESPADLYRDNIEVRDEIKEEHCDDCIHDYPSPKIATELKYLPKHAFWRKRLSLSTALAEDKVRSLGTRHSRTPASDYERPDSVLIFGWYGTETAGDKAILGQLLHETRQDLPDATVRLASLYPYYTEWTLQELGYPDVDVIPTYSSQFLKQVRNSDEVVMGGGPLMHIDTLGVVLTAFRTAKQAGNRTRIEGCGIGPLDGGEKYCEGVRRILELSDEIKLRNDGAVAAAYDLVDRDDIVNTGDPAFDFVHRWKNNHPCPEQRNLLNLYLREWPREYGKNLDDEQFDETKAAFERETGEWVAEICERYDLRPRLLPMHYFFIGDDDREFARSFATEELEARGLDPIVEDRPLSVSEVLSTMQEGTLSLCMRYHSTVFASELGEEFLAIDYSQGGKVARYLNDRNQTDRMIDIVDIADGEWKKMIDRATPPVK